MSHFQFIFAFTVLVLTGTLTFAYHHLKSDLTSETTTTAQAQKKGAKSPIRYQRASFSPTPSSSNRTLSNRAETTQVKLTAPMTRHLQKAELATVNTIVEKINQDAQSKLNKLTGTYQLSPAQQEEILPYIVAHHKQAHPALLVGGRPIPSVNPGASLDDSIYPILRPDQQGILSEKALDDDAWWKDVIDQLDSDLDQAIESGEMVPAPDVEAEEDLVVAPPSNEAAAADGTSSSHASGNLFDLLGQ
jgi:hypothetical protein